MKKDTTTNTTSHSTFFQTLIFSNTNELMLLSLKLDAQSQNLELKTLQFICKEKKMVRVMF